MSRKGTSPVASKARRSGLRPLFGFLALLSLAALAIGFVSFATHVDRLETPETLPQADGIVVWTGRGGGRLEMAGQLLRDGRGERLLISGVNDQVDLTDIMALTGLTDELANCCVDLDYVAEDTRGNATETAIWAEALGYDHILLVTSAYHMPRARIEIAHEIGRIVITPVPVGANDDAKWWRDGARFQRLMGEYSKYLLAMAQGRTEPEDDQTFVLPNDVPQPDADAGAGAN